MSILKPTILIALLSISFSAFSAESLCDVLNLPNCTSVTKMSRRSSAQSVPSAATAAQFNPANVSLDRGFGLETFYQPGNSPTVSLVTGTGRMGAGLISSRIENAFFGNRVPETGSEFLKRNKSQTQHIADKYTLSVGAGVFKRKHVGLDIGAILKFNNKIKKVNPGLGASLRVGPFNFGMSSYKDDFLLKTTPGELDPKDDVPYNVKWNGNMYQESFYVTSMFAGVKIKNVFLDVGRFTTQYKFYDTDDFSMVTLYSGSVIVGKFLFNAAMRKEDSPSMKFKNDKLVDEQYQTSYYGGVQYSVNKFIVIGAHYNYYLLNDFSGSFAVFF